MTPDQAKKYFLEVDAAGVTAFHVDICREQPQAAISKLPYAQKYTILPAASQCENWSALHLATQFASIELLKKLLATGLFPINARDKKQRTPLHIAALSGRLEVALLLVDAGADPGLQDHVGFTAFHLEHESLATCYIKFSVADVQALYAAFDAKRKSCSGLPHPFITRILPSTENTTKTDLNHLIEKHNLTADDALAHAQKGTHLIPYYGHFFWIGSAFDNPDYRQNILTFKTHFPELTLILWVDHPTDEVVQWCLAQKIVLLHTHVLLDDVFQNMDHYLLEMQKGNPGAAVDHLRIECLDRFGGWYFDTDVQCVQRIEPVDYAQRHTLLFFYKAEGKPYYNNCIMASKPNNHYFKITKTIVSNNYLHKRYDKNSRILSGYDMRHKMTLDTSGPNSLKPMISMYVIGGDPGIGMINTQKFATSCDRNWIRPAKKMVHEDSTKAETILAFQQLINNFSHDLMFEAQTLYCDLYEPVFAKFSTYHLASFAFYFLLSFHAQAIKPVKQLLTFKCLTEEINYKNQFGHEDIIAYHKKGLQMIESRYLPIEGLKMRCYTALHPLDVNHLFYQKYTWESIKHILYHVDRTFADQATSNIARYLLQDKRFLALKKLADQLLTAWQGQRVEQQRRILAGLGDSLFGHFNRGNVY